MILNSKVNKPEVPFGDMIQKGGRLLVSGGSSLVSKDRSVWPLISPEVD